MRIYVKYHNPRLIKLDKLGIGDWIDLRAAEDVNLHKGEFRLISLGISVKLPEGYEAHIAHERRRSSRQQLFRDE